MPRHGIDLDGSKLIVERAVSQPSDLTIVERKGWGHPDTLADHLAERLSRVYSRYTLAKFGVVLQPSNPGFSGACAATEPRSRESASISA